MARLAAQRIEDHGAVAIIRAGTEEIVKRDPTGEARAEHIGMPRRLVPGAEIADPVGDQQPRLPPRPIAADRAQIAQPFEAMQGSGELAAGTGMQPGRRFRLDDRTGERELVRQNRAAARRVARPGIAGQGQ